MKWKLGLSFHFNGNVEDNTRNRMSYLALFARDIYN